MSQEQLNKTGFTAVEPSNLAKMLKDESDVVLIDVRSPQEFSEAHIPSARNIPLPELTAERIKAEGLADKRLAVVCQGGGRSTRACELLVASGCQTILNVSGGTKAWRQSGLPTNVGDSSGGKSVGISIERQVRIIAGLLAALGGFGALFISPLFGAISAFVGCGLVFAGVTDTCGMAIALAYAPWNRSSASTAKVSCKSGC